MSIFKRKKAIKDYKSISTSTRSKLAFRGCPMSVSGNHMFTYSSQVGKDKCAYCGMVNDK